MVPVNDDQELNAPVEDMIEAPESPDTPVESPAMGDAPASDAVGADEARASRSRKAKASGSDLMLTRAIQAVVVILVLFAAYFGYSYYQAQQQARLSNPALEVVDQVQKLVDKSPNNAALRVRLGEALAAAGDSNTAKAQLLAALKIDPKTVGAYQDLAEIALTEKNTADAEIYLKKLLDVTADGQFQNINDRREFAFFNLGEITLAQKRWTEAIGYFNAAIKIRKDASDTYLRLAQALNGSGDAAGALEQANIALQFDPKFPEAHYFRGTLYMAQNDTVDAAWDFRAAIDFAPDQQQPKDALAALGTFDKWMAAAQSAYSDGELAVAGDDVSIARSIDPKSYEAAMLHGRILDQQAKYSEAADAYTIALKIKPGDKVAAAALKAAQANAKKDAK